jgi:hypothetical protein
MSVLLVVNYRVSGDLEAFKARAPTVAARIAAEPELKWKIWGLSPDGAGLSAYLFETADAADAFINGPIIAGLKANPAVQAVSLTSAPVEAALSTMTHAAFAA